MSSDDRLEAALRIRLPASPYPGLRPFEPEEWPIFFGRERMVDEVLSRLLAQRVLVLHGDSGCGKSSLIRAGVLPKLQQANARGGNCWRTCIALPGDAPLWNIAVALAGPEEPGSDPERVRKFRRALNFGCGAPAALASLLGSEQYVCLLVDQLEEVFVHARRRGPQEARLLAELLIHLHANPLAGRLHVVLTMRSEFIGACGRYPGLAEMVNATQYLLPRMGCDDLQRAIREPAAVYGAEVSARLATRLVADTGNSQDQLPLIQHGLMLMHRRLIEAHPEAASHSSDSKACIWDGRPRVPKWRLDMEHCADEGLIGLLCGHADAVMCQAQAACPPSEETARVVEELFKALTEINAEGRALRRPRPLAELVAVTGSDEARLRGIIDLYRAEGVSLLRPHGSDPLADTQVIDIGHEALIRCWRRLGGDVKNGWLQGEFRNGMIWRALLVHAESFEADPENVLGAAVTDDWEKWIRGRNAAWAERYGGGWDRVQKLLAASAATRDRLRDEQVEADRRHQEARLHGQRLKLLYVVVPLLLLSTLFAGWQWFVAQQDLALAKQQSEVADATRLRNEELTRNAQATLELVEAEVASVSPEEPSTSRKLQDLLKPLKEQSNRWSSTALGAPVPGAAGPRVYIYIASEAQRPAALALERYLERLTLDSGRVAVPGIEAVNTLTSRSVLRCFRAHECATEAPRLMQEVNRLLPTNRVELQDLSAHYGDTRIRPRHYEVWFSDGEVRVSGP